MDMYPLTDKNLINRPERLEARVSRELKSRLQYAASLQGSSLSEFLLRSAEKAANEVIHESQIIQFSIEDSRAFADAIFSPPKPNSKLRSAYSDYKKEIASE